MNTDRQNKHIRAADDALNGLSANAFSALVQDRAYSMPPEELYNLSNKLARIADHKQRGGLDQLMRKADGAP